MGKLLFLFFSSFKTLNEVVILLEGLRQGPVEGLHLEEETEKRGDGATKCKERIGDEMGYVSCLVDVRR